MPEVKTGNLLLAEPFMLDKNFKKTVVLVADHSISEGTVGFVLNRPTNLVMSELIFDFPEFNGKIYYGGPVGSNTIHYVHKVGDVLEESREIGNGVYWSGNFDRLKFLIENKLVGEDDIKFFIGYSGWEAGQLNEELESNSWIVTDAKSQDIFDTENDVLWNEVLGNIGGHFRVIADLADDISLN